MHRFVRLATAALVALAVAAAPVAAGAAPPYAAPESILSEGFEGALSPSITIESIYDYTQPIAPAWWGPVSNVAHSGTRSLWGAGMTPAGTPGSWVTPPARSRGTVTMALPQLKDFYSSQISLWYWMPSLGWKDEEQNAFQMYWYRTRLSDGKGTAISARTSATAASNSFVKVSRDLIDAKGPLAGTGGTAVVYWFDYDEDGSAKAPTIDDLAITGYRYGPVRNLKATPGAAEMVLTWDPPYRVQGQTVVDTRPIAYRVWRSPAGADLWTELTSSPISGTTFTDGTPANNVSYNYAVQAWDPNGGAGKGELAGYATAAASGGVVVTPATLSISSPPVTGYTWQSVAVSGVLAPAHTAGTNQVTVVAERMVGGSWTPAGSWSLPVSGTGAYSMTLLPSAGTGTWQVRATHMDAEHEIATPWKTFTVTDSVLIGTPSKPSRAYRNKAFTSTGTLKPRHTPGSKPVKIEAYLYSTKYRKWYLKKTVYAKAVAYSSYTKYTAPISLPYTGTWKLRAVHPGHTGQATTYTSYTGTFSVK